MNLKKLFFICFSFFLLNCGSIQQGGYIIDDYLIVPTEATNTIGTKNLNVFVFENDLTTPPIELFLAEKFQLETYQTREFWVTTPTKDRLYIKILERDEIEKFLDLSQYAARIQETKGNRDIRQSKYLALSVTDENGEDCLSEKSLFYNIATQYLKNLKDEYLRKR
ncbi:MAG: hypothetical protein AB7D46_10635 [Flavobacteriaceae bacterium]